VLYYRYAISGKGKNLKDRELKTIMKKFDVLVIGELNVDLILNSIDSFPEMGKEKLARQMDLTLGSSSAIFASNLSSLGAKVAFLGKLGEDVFGDLVISSLKSKKVHTGFIVRNPVIKTGATIVLNYAEDRAMVTHPGAMEHLTMQDIDERNLQQARHLHVSSYFLQPGIKGDIVTIFKRARDLGLTTSFDPQWDPHEKWDLDLKQVLPLVDVLLPNEQELVHLTGEADLSSALESLRFNPNMVIVKRGNKGSLAFYQGKQIRQEPFLNQQVVDAIGAGDSFNAGFIFKFIQKRPVEECLVFGNLMGALNTTAAGGTAAFSDYQAIMDLAKKRFNYTEKMEGSK
jgi:sugar/nucleoside kinase (ribokinase family)